jgi:hypothetical protein
MSLGFGYLKGLRFLVVYGLLPFSAFAQDKWQNPEHTNENYMSLKTGWYAGANFGGTLFYGDVSLYNYFPKIADFKKSFASAYSLYGGKKFKYGLIAELQVSKGSLTGEKIANKLYPRYFIADYMDYSVNFKYNLSQQVFRKEQQRKFFNRLSVYATAGVGQVFFRSRLYKQANNGLWYLEHTNGYVTTGIDSAGITSAGGLVTKKAAMVSAIIIPVGGKINYKLNGKTDITFDFRYTTVLSDKLDSWERSWTHYDKYLYMALGLTFNFGKTEGDDMPGNQRYLKHEKDKGVSSADVSEDDSKGKITKRGLFKKKAKSDKDAEMRMKMYELMLMMFEMQYLN